MENPTILQRNSLPSNHLLHPTLQHKVRRIPQGQRDCHARKVRHRCSSSIKAAASTFLEQRVEKYAEFESP
jgi:hypothetical protein